jgi:hypothetical protein
VRPQSVRQCLIRRKSVLRSKCPYHLRSRHFLKDTNTLADEFNKLPRLARLPILINYRGDNVGTVLVIG